MSVYLQKYANEHSRFMVIDQALVHYRDEGSGPCLVLLHGSFSSLHTFDDWVTALRGQYRIIRLDLPGFGLSGTHPSHEYGVQKYLDVLDVFLQRMGINDCALVGSSLGGWLAWEYAIEHPEMVSRLVLISAAGFLDEKSIPVPFKMARAPMVNKLVKFVITRNLVETFLKQVYADTSKITPAMIDRYYDLFSREGNPEAFISLAKARPIDHTPRLPRLHMPTLILWGDQDIWLPVENGYRFLHAIPSAELIIYEGLGHVPMEENPTLTAEDLVEFLEKKDPPPHIALKRGRKKTAVI